VVAEREPGRREDRSGLLGADVERLVVDALKLGLEEDEVLAAVAAHWRKLARNQKQVSYK
jgi:hypothetical protein